jgi:hypothetical protein
MSAQQQPAKTRNAMIKHWVDQFAHMIQSNDMKEYIQGLVLEPFLKYIFQRAFPYMLIAFCIFGGMLLFVIMTFVLLLMKKPVAVACPKCSFIVSGG